LKKKYDEDEVSDPDDQMDRSTRLNHNKSKL